MLREHKPPPIRRIRISDFGLMDPKRDPDRHQNCITWSLTMLCPSKKIRQNPFTSLRVIQRSDRQTDRQTNRQTDRTKNITSFFGGGNNRNMYFMVSLSMQNLLHMVAFCSLLPTSLAANAQVGWSMESVTLCLSVYESML